VGFSRLIIAPAPKYESLRGATNPLGGFISAFSEILFSCFYPEIAEQSNQ
jgi:hypothetical protein